MELGLEKKVILVTGGASGIGGDVVKKLEDLDDIQKVFSNLNITTDLVNEFQKT